MRRHAKAVGARAIRFLTTFVIVTLATAMLLEFVPGGAAAYMAGPDATPEVIAALNETYGFDEPVTSRYVAWLGDFVQGDLGTSYTKRQPVGEAIFERLPVTLELALLGMLIALMIALPLAMATSRRAGTRVDKAFNGLSSAVISIPPFVVGVVLLYFLALKLELFPVLGWVSAREDLAANLHGMTLPVLSFALVEAVILHQVLHAELTQTLQQDFISLARAKGLSPRAVMWRHALRPSSFSTLTLGAVQLARLLGGSVVVESVFVLPGLGTLLLAAIQSRDLPMVQGGVAFIVVVYLGLNFIVDSLYGLIDPRTRASRASRAVTSGV